MPVGLELATLVEERCSNGLDGSRNVITALEKARKRGMLTVALLGYDRGEIKRSGLADLPIVVHCDYIARIQEVTASICHIVREVREVLHRGKV